MKELVEERVKLQDLVILYDDERTGDDALEAWADMLVRQRGGLLFEDEDGDLVAAWE